MTPALGDLASRRRELQPGAAEVVTLAHERHLLWGRCLATLHDRHLLLRGETHLGESQVALPAHARHRPWEEREKSTGLMVQRGKKKNEEKRKEKEKETHLGESQSAISARTASTASTALYQRHPSRQYSAKEVASRQKILQNLLQNHPLPSSPRPHRPHRRRLL